MHLQRLVVHMVIHCGLDDTMAVLGEDVGAAVVSLGDGRKRLAAQ